MPPRVHPRERVPTRVGTPEQESVETTTRENDGNWGRAALEVRRDRTLTSRVPLRGVTGSTPGRGSTSRGVMRNSRRELLPSRKGKEFFPVPRVLGSLIFHVI
ncbi:hypothetical protein NDU88_004849 [Pleurodeles waltl]|uniref:Uncharacterized protein n=1 Tax=Pleurodeles waltl TaxID=8319 RepID=A0AAV7M7H5_PLEWA|nr:hypothetical protein NDU88_004849 [Pleurodeles waltl]